MSGIVCVGAACGAGVLFLATWGWRAVADSPHSFISMKVVVRNKADVRPAR